MMFISFHIYLWETLPTSSSKTWQFSHQETSRKLDIESFWACTPRTTGTLESSDTTLWRKVWQGEDSRSTIHGKLWTHKIILHGESRSFRIIQNHSESLIHILSYPYRVLLLMQLLIGQFLFAHCLPYCHSLISDSLLASSPCPQRFHCSAAAAHCTSHLSKENGADTQQITGKSRLATWFVTVCCLACRVHATFTKALCRSEMEEKPD